MAALFRNAPFCFTAPITSISSMASTLDEQDVLKCTIMDGATAMALNCTKQGLLFLGVKGGVRLKKLFLKSKWCIHTHTFIHTYLYKNECDFFQFPPPL